MGQGDRVSGLLMAARHLSTYKEVGWQRTHLRDRSTCAAGDARGEGGGICLQGPHRCVAKSR